MRKLWAVSAVLVLAMAAGVTQAAPVLRLEDVGTGTGVVIFDNGPGDLSPTPDVVVWSGAIAGFDVNVTTLFSGSTPSSGTLDLGTVNVRFSGTGSLRIVGEDTGYTLIDDGYCWLTGAATGALAGPSASTATFQSWANPNDLVPDLGPSQPVVGLLPALGAVPPGSVAAWSSPFTTGVGAFSNTSQNSLVVNGPFSVFVQVDLTFAGTGTQTMLLSSDELQQVSRVPEPASLLLLSGGIAAVVVRRRRK